MDDPTTLHHSLLSSAVLTLLTVVSEIDMKKRCRPSNTLPKDSPRDVHNRRE